MRRRAKPWGEALWDRVERFLGELDEGLDDLNSTRLYSSETEMLEGLQREAHEIRKAMVAENARRAEVA